MYHNTPLFLKDLLDDYLKEIEEFYNSSFWKSRFKRRLREENIVYKGNILETISYLRKNTIFKIFFAPSSYHGVSNKHTMIALNLNSDPRIKNVIMHEFGHRQYNLKEFNIVRYLNKIIIGIPKIKINLTDRDYLYFTNDNELRLRIIPIIKEMYDNNWEAKDAYYLSNNLETLKLIYSKKYIIYLLKNII